MRGEFDERIKDEAAKKWSEGEEGHISLRRLTFMAIVEGKLRPEESDLQWTPEEKLHLFGIDGGEGQCAACREEYIRGRTAMLREQNKSPQQIDKFWERVNQATPLADIQSYQDIATDPTNSIDFRLAAIKLLHLIASSDNKDEHIYAANRALLDLKRVDDPIIRKEITNMEK